MFSIQTEWDCPESFPDLSGEKYIAIDLETKDPDLKSRGSGAIQGRGEIVGIAVAVYVGVAIGTGDGVEVGIGEEGVRVAVGVCVAS